ncbi:FIST N-terminal domain-containing protein [Amaricoccus macauensis]|uniref:FIST N-terminal domain-containing protein n=1 Tax=Amaricoccus macauensis TaxID=57001 RepID=UPI003C7EC561
MKDLAAGLPGSALGGAQFKKAYGERRPNDPMIKVAVSRAETGALALREVAAELIGRKSSFVFLLFPPRFDPGDLEAPIGESFRHTTVFGCTTAGQITPAGYETDALVAIAFPSEHFRFSSKLFKPLAPVSIEQTAVEAERMAAQFRPNTGWNRLAITVADGLSKQEDVFVAALHAGLREVPVFGGSAADGQSFKSTFVLHGGRFHTNAALLLLLETDLEFRGFGFDHFETTERKLVVTGAIPEERLVVEINGTPAAKEYARLLGLTVEELSPIVFAENPVLVRNGNVYHVRGIQQIHESGGLTLLSAIDEGLLLKLGRGKEIVATLYAGLDVRGEQGQKPDFILGFDCFLRKLEIVHKGLDREVSEAMRSHNVIGFNTYGEQHLGVHVNQTFVGVAFFRPRSVSPF